MKDQEYVWARVGAGRLRRMRRSQAVKEGLEIDTREGRGFGAHGVRREFMTQAERREIYLKTGVEVEDRDDMRKAYKSKNLREAEKGEFCNDMMDALKEAGETNSVVDERYSLGNLDLFGDEARRKPFNAQERFVEHCRRLGIEPD